MFGMKEADHVFEAILDFHAPLAIAISRGHLATCEEISGWKGWDKKEIRVYLVDRAVLPLIYQQTSSVPVVMMVLRANKMAQGQNEATRLQPRELPHGQDHLQKHKANADRSGRLSKNLRLASKQPAVKPD